VVSIATPGGFEIMGQWPYEDELVKLDGEWKIRYWRVENDCLVAIRRGQLGWPTTTSRR
jgi:hypothetical protein